jgi:processive 1,2-diacylglycerol beta-glucosyltransferase
MDELMTVSDLVIGKPGGLTTSEALSKGLPFVIVNPIPGQEERNSDHLLEQGAAIRCNNLPTLAFKVDHVLSAPERLKLLKQRARALGHPTAAFTVAQECLSL